MDDIYFDKEKKFLKFSSKLNTFFLASIFLIILFYAFYAAREIFVPIVIALLFSFLLNPCVRFLKRFHIPRHLGAGLIILFLLFIICACGYELSKPATHWLSQEPEAISLVDKKLTIWGESFSTNFPNLSKINDHYALFSQNQKISNQNIVPNKASFIIGTVVLTWQFLVQFASAIILLYFFLIYEHDFMRLIIHWMTNKKNKDDALAVSNEIQNQIFNYLFARTLINIGLGVIVTVLMFALGMPDPILWGVMTGLLEYIPYLGALISLVVITMVALFSFVNIGYAFLITLLVFIVLVIEANIVAPIVFGKTLTLSPVIIFLSLMFFSFIWGIAGTFVAVPMIVAIKIISENIFQNHFK